MTLMRSASVTSPTLSATLKRLSSDFPTMTGDYASDYG